MTDAGLFAIEGISFAYDENPVLDGIDLTLSAGQFYGIVGPNGCGKTTFLDLLTGSRKPRTGTITYKGRRLDAYGRRELARQLSLVPQEFDTGFGFTVEEIVMMGRHPHIDRFATPSQADWDAVDEALSAIGIAPLRFRYTNTLSGGQKQRTVVARALAQDTPVIFFDEATASLDIKYTLQIFNLARRLVKNEGRTVIAVIHNLDLAAAYCDHLVFMKEGRLYLEGPTSSTMTAETIAEVFGVRSRVAPDLFNGRLHISYHYWE